MFLSIQLDNKAALVQVMALHWVDDRPLPEPIMTEFTDPKLEYNESMPMLEPTLNTIANAIQHQRATMS